MGLFKHVLTYLLGGLRQDQGLELVAVGEHEVAHHVVLIQIVVAAPALVGMLGVLLEFCAVEVQVAQASERGLAVVHVGATEEAEHAHVKAVQRAFDNEGVELLVLADESRQVFAVHDGLQA